VFVRFGLDFDALDHIENFIPSDPENESTGRFGEMRSRFYEIGRRKDENIKPSLRDQELSGETKASFHDAGCSFSTMISCAT